MDYFTDYGFLDVSDWPIKKVKILLKNKKNHSYKEFIKIIHLHSLNM